MTAAQTEPATRQPRQDRTARWPWYLVRTVVTALAVDIFLQSVFAGRFLSGDYPQLLVHRTNAIRGGCHRRRRGRRLGARASPGTPVGTSCTATTSNTRTWP